MTSKIDGPAPAQVYDDALSWLVPSRSDPHVVYHVELADYNGNGRCDCPDFQFHFEELLAKRYTPERALAEGLVKLRPYHNEKPEHALRCFHVMEARDRLATNAIKSLHAAATHVRAQTNRPAGT